MMTPDQKADAAKGTLAWIAVAIGNGIAHVTDSLGIRNWGEASQFAAFILSTLLICDFFWRRFFRKYFERRWPRRFPIRRKRRADFVDSTDNTPLGGR